MEPYINGLIPNAFPSIIPHCDIPELKSIMVCGKVYRQLVMNSSIWKEIASKIGCPERSDPIIQYAKIKKYFNSCKLECYLKREEHALFFKEPTIARFSAMSQLRAELQLADSRFIVGKEITQLIAESNPEAHLEIIQKPNEDLHTWEQYINLSTYFPSLIDKNEEWMNTDAIESTLCEVDLSDSGLSVLPKELAKLPISTLLLNTNFLSDLPEEFGQNNSIDYLEIFSNNFAKIPACVMQMNSLTILHLDENKLRTIPDEIQNLKNLTDLGLSKNRLSEFPSPVCQLTKLENLWISHNSIDTIPAEIGRLTSLYVLKIHHNELLHISAELSKLSGLDRLKLHVKEFPIIPAEILSTFPYFTCNVEEGLFRCSKFSITTLLETTSTEVDEENNEDIKAIYETDDEEIYESDDEVSHKRAREDDSTDDHLSKKPRN